MNFKNPKCLDLCSESGPIYHGNYRSCRSTDAVKQYCTKEGTFLTNLDPSTLLKKNVWLEARTLARETSLTAAISHLEGTPQGAMQLTLNGDRILRNLQVLTKKPLRVDHPLTSFSVPTWDRTKTLILTGPTNAGKTALAKALLPNALFISHIDGLKNFSTLYDGIIMDDMTFTHYPRESQIHLVDTAEEREIHCRHTNGRIPADVPRIITTNRNPSAVLFVDDPAIKRRIVCWEVIDHNTITEFE